MLSPCLFSLLIADLPQFLKDRGGIGVRVHTSYITCLLFADDGAIVADTKEDLQCMLMALNEYCNQWRMIVNVEKTEIVVFNRQVQSVEEKWTYEGNQLKVVSEFKYLGLMFHDSRRAGATIEHRLKQAKRLVATWKRRCRIWLFKPDDILNQFMTCILPALEYGSCLWGAGKRRGEARVWEEFETFWRQIAKLILDLPIRAPTQGVFGELGWYPFWVRAGWQAAKYWTRAVEMKDDCIVKEALRCQWDVVEQGKECWLACLKQSLSKTSVGRECWDKWTGAMRSARRLGCKNYKVAVDQMTGKVRVQEVRWEDDVHDALRVLAESKWYEDINRRESTNGQFGNKLRTYCRFKTEWGQEEYLSIVNSKQTSD